jgi:hypothetical protein
MTLSKATQPSFREAYFETYVPKRGRSLVLRMQRRSFIFSIPKSSFANVFREATVWSCASAVATSLYSNASKI